MLRRNLISRAVGAAKHDRNFELAAGHVKHLRSRVNDLISREDRKVESHELDDRTQARHGCTNSQTGKAKLSDRSVDDPLRTKLFEQTARHFVRALILGN